MFGIIGLVFFGALVGWATSLAMGTKHGCIANIVLGIIGALIGSFLVSFLTGKSVQISLNLSSFVVAFLGAILFVGTLNLIKGKK